MRTEDNSHPLPDESRQTKAEETETQRSGFFPHSSAFVGSRIAPMRPSHTPSRLLVPGLVYPGNNLAEVRDSLVHPSSPRRSRELLDGLLASGIIHPEDWQSLSSESRLRIQCAGPEREALDLLLEHGLITQHQKTHIEAGCTFGLVLGNYRVLDRLGDGGMAVVYKAEHLDMRHLVAIKMLPHSASNNPYLQSRFAREIRTIAQLRHPNIVAALDAGRTLDHDGTSLLWYMVMEYVPGMDLEEFILTKGPLPPARAVNIIHQIACALVETSKTRLVHRDIKPSNIMVTADDVAKLLDFGLSRNFEVRLTQPGVVLGSIDFMAPEQARDASNVDIRADIYGLGGTLYWALTGRLPFSGGRHPSEVLASRQVAAPPSLRAVRPELPRGLDEVIARMMALNPEDRYRTPRAVIQALLPFLKPEPLLADCGLRLADAPNLFPDVGHLAATGQSTLAAAGQSTQEGHGLSIRNPCVLVVDDEESVRRFCTMLLQVSGIEVLVAQDAEEALHLLGQNPVDLVLTDIMMPGMSGLDLLRHLREAPPSANLKVIFFSGHATSDEMAELLQMGADDFLTKPVSMIQLQERVRAALRLKEAQDRATLLNQHLLSVNAELERNLDSQQGDLVAIRNALVVALSRLVSHRDGEAGKHPQRMQLYSRCLAEAASHSPCFKEQVNEDFIAMLECCASLHDIGKSGLPDHILLKPGKLTGDERILMQTHTTLGADMLEAVSEQFPGARGFLQMAIDIVLSHHERYDGAGYPQRLVGNAIPLAARIVSIADVYDALRCRRAWKPALSHNATLQLMTEASPGQFDPSLLRVFVKCAGEFERIYKEWAD
jgi:response regulator RpfG family c-di-GMP phosphodiesterase/serine/threonine protein kinase